MSRDHHMQPPRVALVSLPPYLPAAPSPSLCYLKGYVEKQSPEIHVEVFHWNQTIPRKCKDLGAVRLPEGFQYIDFFTALFHGCYQGFHGEVDVTHPLVGGGAIWVADHSTPTFVKLVKDICEHIDMEIDANHLDTCDIYGCSADHNQLISSLTVLSRLKRANPRGLAVLGGVVKSEAVLLLEAFPFLDLCVIGEGEHTFSTVCRQHPYYEFSSVPGVAYRKDGIVKANDPIPFPADIDTVWADYSGFDWTDLDTIVIPIWDSRGCVWGRCTWCNENRLSPRAVDRSPQSIVSEAGHHLQAIGATNHAGKRVFLSFLGNTSRGSSRDRFVSVLQELVRLSTEACPQLMIYRCTLSPIHIDEDIARLLNSLHVHVSLGFEYWSDRVLGLMNKPHRMVHTIRALKLIERNPHIRFMAFNMLFGYPGETVADIGDVIKNLHALRLVLHGLARNKQVDLMASGHHVFGIGLNPDSPLGSTWDYDNPIMQDMVRNSVTCRALTSMVSDVEVCRKIAIHENWYWLPDVTSTSHVVRAEILSFFHSLATTEVSFFVSPAGFPALTVRFEDQTTDFVFNDEVYRKLLQLTDGIITLKELRGALGQYPQEKVQECISDLCAAGFLFVDKQRAINTLPWQFQQMIDSHCDAERRPVAPSVEGVDSRSSQDETVEEILP